MNNSSLRIDKYKISLYKYIKDKNIIFTNIEENVHLIYKNIIKHDNIFSVLSLSLINEKSKKNKINIQGYNLASLILLMNTLLLDKMYDNSQLLLIISSLYDSLNRHMDIIKLCDDSNNTLGSIYNKSLTLINNIIKNSSQIKNWKWTFNNNKKSTKDTIIEWFVKNDNTLLLNYNTMDKIDITEWNAYNNLTIFNISKLTWILSYISCEYNYNEKDIELITNIANCFSMMYIISNNFNNLEDDILNKNVNNYIIICGIQQAYANYLNYKTKYIELTLQLNIQSGTIDEILKYFDDIVEQFINITNPDIKSSFSSTIN